MGFEIVEAELTYEPNTTVTITDPSTAAKVEKLMDSLDDLNDVTATHTNFDVLLED